MIPYWFSATRPQTCLDSISLSPPLLCDLQVLLCPHWTDGGGWHLFHWFVPVGCLLLPALCLCLLRLLGWTLDGNPMVFSSLKKAQCHGGICSNYSPFLESVKFQRIPVPSQGCFYSFFTCLLCQGISCDPRLSGSGSSWRKMYTWLMLGGRWMPPKSPRLRQVLKAHTLGIPLSGAKYLKGFMLYDPAKVNILYIRFTSSTAQGGGGSFKNRKPIGEVGCCESGMAERIHWWTERCLRSPLFCSLSLTIYLPTYLPIYLLSIYLSIYLSLSLFFI